MKMTRILGQSNRTAATLAGIAMAMSASAAWGTLVTSWTYTTNATFTAATFGSGSGCTTNTSSILSWGSCSGSYTDPKSDSSKNVSALTIGTGTSDPNRDNGGPVNGSVNTTIGGSPDPLLGQIGDGTTFTHWNNTIDAAFSTLTGGIVHDTLSLTGVLPNPPYPGSTDNLPSIDFDFSFIETPNDPSGGCAGGTPKPCADLFGIIGTPNLNVAFTYQDPSSLAYENYLASIFVLGPNGSPSPIGTLLPAECTELGLSAGCQGFRTVEGKETTAQFAFAITTQPINRAPEPGSLALLGIALFALVGFGVSTRRAPI